MPESPTLSLFLSSDARPRYAQDVLAALALPTGAILQFRYAAGYVDPVLRDACSNQSVIGRQCLVAYVSQRDAARQHLIPVRYATVVGVDTVADLFVFRFRLSSYPDLADWSLEPDRLSTEARSLIDGMVKRNSSFFNAVFRAPKMPVETGIATDDGTAWIEISRRLAAVSTFARCHFLQVGAPRSDDGSLLPLDELGEVSVVEGRSLAVRLTYYCDEYYDAPKQIEAETLGENVMIVSAATVPVASRYDHVEFRLHAQPVASRAFSRLQVKMTAADEDGDLATVVDFPISVRPSRRDLLARVAASGVGAFAVAMPAILGPDSDLALRIVLASAGAALIAFGTTVLSRKR